MVARPVAELRSRFETTLNISRRLSSCLILATVCARACAGRAGKELLSRALLLIRAGAAGSAPAALDRTHTWILCAALACLGCGRPRSPGGAGARAGRPGRSTRGPAGEHCAGLLTGADAGRPVRNATVDDSRSTIPPIAPAAARPRLLRVIAYPEERGAASHELEKVDFLFPWSSCDAVTQAQMPTMLRTLGVGLMAASTTAFSASPQAGTAPMSLRTPRPAVCSLQVSGARRGRRTAPLRGSRTYVCRAHVCAFSLSRDWSEVAAPWRLMLTILTLGYPCRLTLTMLSPGAGASSSPQVPARLFCSPACRWSFANGHPDRRHAMPAGVCAAAETNRPATNLDSWRCARAVGPHWRTGKRQCPRNRRHPGIWFPSAPTPLALPFHLFNVCPWQVRRIAFVQPLNPQPSILNQDSSSRTRSRSTRLRTPRSAATRAPRPHPAPLSLSPLFITLSLSRSLSLSLALSPSLTLSLSPSPPLARALFI